MSELDTIKKMPFSIEAEQAILGSILIDSEKLNEVLTLIKADDFYLEQHQAIFTAMVEMFITNKIIDLVTIVSTLTQLGNYTEGDAAKYIKLLVDLAGAASNVTEYAAIVKDKALLRLLIEASRDISDTAFSELGAASDTIDFAEQRIFEIAQNRYNVSFDHIRDVIIKNYATLNTLKNDPESLSGTKTGFGGLDSLLVGMGDGDLIVLGGRPGMGKTTFAVNIATHVAKRTKKEVAIFSLEMTSEQLVARILCSEAMIDSHSMRTGRLDGEQWKRLAEAASALSETNILIDDTSSISATSMKAKLRRLKNLGLVVVDYLQLMQGEKHTENRVLEIGQITRAFKLMAKDLHVPIILCSQLGRATETRSDKMPVLSDLRDSGTIEQDADIVLLLYRDDYYKKQGDDDKQHNNSYNSNNNDHIIAKCSIAKNRHGGTNVIPLGWYGHIFKFTEIEEYRNE
ncbi:MAG: replicative DNA helicase [Clostridiales bacterium GWF2_36_10]|nr:MAG: replicative DNA helicase [Clostridiales bacterium GWF2_36_10]HAN21035.1 replicative DNA helicase [Clostridiales bacterium]